MRFANLLRLSAVAVVTGAATTLVLRAQPTEGEGSSKALAAQLRTIGQAVLIYAAENKGYLPPALDNAALLQSLDEPTRALLADPSLISPFTASGTPVRMAKIRGSARAPLMLYPLDDGSLLTLFLDGHVDRLYPSRLVAALKDAPATQPGTDGAGGTPAAGSP